MSQTKANSNRLLKLCWYFLPRQTAKAQPLSGKAFNLLL